MAKGKRPARKVRKTAKMRLVRSVRPAFDKAAMDYVKLLLDPCGAPLTHPVGTPTGGILIRAQSIVPLGTPSSSTAGLLHWIPGAINLNNSELLFSTPSSSSVATVMGTSPSAPGKTFITNNASDYRCVAACARIMYDGTELNRSGRIGYGNTIGGSITLSTVTPVDGVISTLTHVERTPQTVAEIRWCPNEADMTFIDPGANIAPQDRERRSAITIAVANYAATFPLTVEFTAVYEYKPVLGQGVVTQNRTASTSPFTVAQVISYINSMAGDPWVHAGMSMARNLILQNAGTMGYAFDRARQQTIKY